MSAVVGALKPCRKHCLSLSSRLTSKYLRTAFFVFARITASVQAQSYRKVLSVPFFSCTASQIPVNCVLGLLEGSSHGTHGSYGVHGAHGTHGYHTVLECFLQIRAL